VSEAWRGSSVSELLEACRETCTDLQRHLKLVKLAEATAREGWCPPSDAEFDDTVILLEVYRDRVEAMLERLQEDLKDLQKLLVNTPKNA
ncbi:MAG: hypothetical protein AB1589_43880, partial [Cyanobacteriota bacterium]